MGTEAEDRRSAPPGAPEDPTDIRRSVAGGLRWNTLNSLSTQVLRTAASLIMVRFLTPKDYGVAAMALLFANFAARLSDFGLSPALIQQRTITEEDRSTAFWTTIMIGLVLTLLAVGLAWPIAIFFHQPRVMLLLSVLSLSFFVGSFGITQASLLRRAMRFRTVAIRVMIATAIASTVAPIVAVTGGGPWALVSYPLVIATMMTLLLWSASEWRPRWVYSRESLKRLGGYGGNYTAGEVVAFLKDNLDNILIGRFLGARALGIYGLAFNVILVPALRIGDPLYNTLFPAFSRLQHEPERTRKLWLVALRGSIALILPMMVGLDLVASDFVDNVLGTHWHDAIPVIRVLSVVPLLYSIGFLGGVYLAAAGRVRLMLYLQVIDTTFAVVGFVLGLHWGIVGVSVGLAIASIPVSAYSCFLAARVLGVSFATFGRTLLGAIQASVLMAGVCFGLREGLVQAGVSGWARLVTVIVAGLVSYGLATAWRNPSLLGEIKTLRLPSAGSESEPGLAPAR